MKLSARKQLKGVVSEVRKGAVTTIVKIEVKPGHHFRIDYERGGR